MPTFTITLRKDHKTKDKIYPIVITIYDGDRKERHPIGWKVPERNWSDEEKKVTGDHADKKKINLVIESKIGELKQRIAQSQINKMKLPIGQIFNQAKAKDSFPGYLEFRAHQLFKEGKISIEQKIIDLADDIRRCLGELNISDIDKHSVSRFRLWLLNKGSHDKNGLKLRANKDVTIKKKFAYCSRFFQELIKDGKVTGPDPFDNQVFKIVKAKKVKLTLKEIDLLGKVELKNINHQLARDMFLFSYYCKGIRFENCATMQKKWIRNGRLNYQINKGLKHLSVKIHSKLQDIIDKYQGADPLFIFPLFTGDNRKTVVGYLKTPTNESKKAYKKVINDRNTVINEWLWKAAIKAEINSDISMHTARHSFAFHLKKLNTSIHAIKESLGHSTTQQTETYLADLEDDIVDSEVEKLYGV